MSTDMGIGQRFVSTDTGVASASVSIDTSVVTASMCVSRDTGVTTGEGGSAK